MDAKRMDSRLRGNDVIVEIHRSDRDEAMLCKVR
jgi:hypothetical protein